MHVLKLTVERDQRFTRAYVGTTVYGRPLKLLVDTGGAASQLPVGFVDKYRIPYRTGTADPIMVDVNGNQLSMPRAYDVPIQFAGSTKEEKIDFLVNPSDKSADQGVFIPQDLVTSGWAMVIDLEHSELRYEPEADAVRNLGPDTRFSVSPMIFPSSTPCGRGLLGADILDRCVLVWGSSKLWASCHP